MDSTPDLSRELRSSSVAEALESRRPRGSGMNPLRLWCRRGVRAGLVHPLSRAEPRLRFDHLTVEHGLSHAWVQSILKDSRGFLWFGTQDGLNRYDGSSIKIYRHDPRDPNSLPSSVAAVLIEDSKKRLWIGSGWGNAGLALYDREHDRFKRYLPNPGQTAGNNVRSIVEDRQGQLWLATDNGIAHLDPETGHVQTLPVDTRQPYRRPEAIVVTLFEDRQERLWVGYASRGCVGSIGRAANTRVAGAERTTWRRWTALEISDFYEDEEGVLWVATLGDGLYRVDASTGRETRYLPDPRDPDSISSARVRRLVPDGKGKLYVGTENGGLDILDLRTRKFAHVPPRPRGRRRA